TPRRTSWYSGRERPAWRMNQTGRRSGRRPEYAVSRGPRTSSDVLTCGPGAVMKPLCLPRRPAVPRGRLVTLAVISANHRHAGLAHVDRLSAAGADRLLAVLADHAAPGAGSLDPAADCGIGGAVVLSTCNRLEV